MPERVFLERFSSRAFLARIGRFPHDRSVSAPPGRRNRGLSFGVRSVSLFLCAGQMYPFPRTPWWSWQVDGWDLSLSTQ